MQNLLVVEDIVKDYAAHRALDHVSISVPQAHIFGLLGPNGAGKTSLIRIINQITAPDSGRVLLNGEPLNKEHVYHIGYLPEERGLYKKMQVGEQAMYLARLKGLSNTDAKKKLKYWFEKMDIMPWWNKKVEDLSKGMAQKVQFIVTILHEPPLLILDEPFSGFDPVNANLIKEEIHRLKENGTTIILSTHNMASVEEICDNIALINRSKKVLDGSVAQVRNDFKENIYEIEFKGQGIGFSSALGSLATLLGSETKNELTKARVKISEGYTANQLVGAILPHVEISALREVIPSMNDVFIKAVSENKA